MTPNNPKLNVDLAVKQHIILFIGRHHAQEKHVVLDGFAVFDVYSWSLRLHSQVPRLALRKLGCFTHACEFANTETQYLLLDLTRMTILPRYCRNHMT